MLNAAKTTKATLRGAMPKERNIKISEHNWKWKENVAN